MTTTANFTTIAICIEDHVATITIDREDVLNAFNEQFSGEFISAMKQVSRDADVRVVVIRGAGRAFSSGQDLGDLEATYVPGHIPCLGEDLRKRQKPVIAAVNGVAAGAGCSLALACDMRIASEHAKFIEVFINVGLIPDSGSTWTLPRIVGLGRAMEMCLTGRPVGAEEALAIGLVNQVVAADELDAVVSKMAGRLASLPSRAIGLTKRLLNESFEQSLTAQLEAEAFAQETAGRTKDHFEGVTAFLQKRTPEFIGE